MEGTMAEIRLFSGDFAPKSWAYCNGAVLAIATNQALFSLLGTTYGGNGTTTFALPDLRGRTVIGPGQGPGLANYSQGQVLGTENVTLLSPNLPSHNHIATVTAGTGTGSATLMGVNDQGGQASPGGNYLGKDTGAGATSYASSGTPVAMNTGSITVASSASSISVNVASNGGTMPHTNVQPSLALNYIICVYGIFPSRN